MITSQQHLQKRLNCSHAYDLANNKEKMHLEEEISKVTHTKTTTTKTPTADLMDITEDASTIQTTQGPYEVGGTQETLVTTVYSFQNNFQ